MPALIDLVGRRFGRLVVVKCHEPSRGRQARRRLSWICRCDCGARVICAGQELRRGESQSCSCLRDELIAARSRSHGEASKEPADRTPEYRAWQEMKRRCLNPWRPGYENYGGRGIRVADAWLHDFPAFLRDLGRRPTDAHSLDRIDPDGHYEPGNVRWSTTEEQRRNQRRPCLSLTGRTFGRLTVIALAAVKPWPRWHCRCACGHEVVAAGGALVGGHTASCGCSRRDAAVHDARGRFQSRVPGG